MIHARTLAICAVGIVGCQSDASGVRVQRRGRGDFVDEFGYQERLAILDALASDRPTSARKPVRLR
jgi:hypothetical protein